MALLGVQSDKQEQTPVSVKGFSSLPFPRWYEGDSPAHEQAVHAGPGGLHLPPHTFN